MDNLLDYRFNKYTSTGNDGIIEHIFNKLNIKEGMFVEFGAWDGIKNSNCRKLYEEGWNGIFIEPDKYKYRNLKKNYKNDKRVICINIKIKDSGKNVFDNVVGLHIGNRNIDFCSIDIDGLDLEVFETFEKHFPTVICIEGGQMLHPYYRRIKKSIAKNNIQQSLSVMVQSFEKKGYKVLCSYQDSFFVKKEYYYLFNVKNNLIELHFNGLQALHRRLPWIYKYVQKNGLTNNIIKNILKETFYFSDYGYKKRKVWVEEKKEHIKLVIEKYRDIELRKNI